MRFGKPCIVMANPPPVVEKKSGMGCCGCGCLILALLTILFLALVGGVCYFGYDKLIELTSMTPSTVQTFDGGADMYNTARAKLEAFTHDVKNHQAASIHLTADEINTFIAHNPDVTNNKIHLFVTMTNDQARLQASIPLSVFQFGVLNDRYLNGDMTFTLHFDEDTKSILITPTDLQIGKKALLGQNADSSSSFDSGFMQSFTPAFNQSFNKGLRKSPEARELLDQAKTIEVKDGELVIETQ